MKPSVCIVTTGQPSTNPRAVKEADALVWAGCDVRMIGAHWANWADAEDTALLASRPWSCELVEWRLQKAPAKFWHSRVRHHAARAVVDWPGLGRLALAAAVARLTPELTARAKRRRADLYIAHNLGALPAAAEAAARFGARLGFDAEDFHSGQFSVTDRSSAWIATVETERKWIPRCDYVTAAAPGIADAYQEWCREQPVLVRNVPPLADRPRTPGAGSADGCLRLYWFSQTIGEGRGLEDVVRAMGRVADARIELHLRGEWDRDYERRLTELARQSGVPAGRILSRPPAAPGEMARLAAAYDIGLVCETGRTPNSEMAQSNKAFTYMLAGVPLLTSDTEGHLELLGQAPGIGWSYPRGNDRALAGVLSSLAGDRAELRRAADGAWACGERRFNWDLEQRLFLAEVQRVLGGQRRVGVA